MSIINSERVMVKSNVYIANINRLLKEVKSNIFANYIHSNSKVIIIMTNKIAAILLWQPLIKKTNDHTSSKSLSGISSGEFTRELDKESLLN